MFTRSLCLSLVFLAGIVRAAQPSFYARQDISRFICPQPQELLLVVDTNGDGIPDLVCDPMLLGNGDGTFRTGPDLNLPGTATSEAIALDANNDGKVDLVIAAYENNQLQLGVLLGNGDGTFQNPIYYPSGVNDDAEDFDGTPVVSGDFNGEGILDVAVLGTHEVVVFAGIGDGSFQAGVPIELSYERRDTSAGMAAADMNIDGRLDLIVNASSEILVLFGNGNGTFQNPIATQTAVKAGFGTFAVGDLNGDGFPDVAILGDESSSVLFYAGKGNGTFLAPSTINISGDAPVQALAIADLNGDGIPDLVTDLVNVAFGEGDGKFASPIYYPVDGGGVVEGGGAIGVGDLRSIGRLDLITTSGGPVSILLNSGKGKYRDGIPTTVAGDFAACSASGDFNGDGIPDMVVSTNAAIVIYLGTGKGGSPFASGATYPLVDAGCPVVGDLNGDGFPDVLVASGPGSGVVVGFLGNGDGTFRQGSSSPVPSIIGFFVLGDFNGDGKLDYATSTNLLAYGNGDGSFGTPAPYVSEVGFNGLFGIATADLNGDGKPDIVVTDATDQLTYVLLNTGTAFQQTVLDVADCGYPSYLALGALTPGGKPDIALSCNLGVGVYLNNGTGGFGNYFLLGSPTTGGNVVIADLNADGVPDIAFQEFSNVAIYLGQGSDTFAAQFYVGTGNSPVGLLALDTHGQNPRRGKPDLVETDESGVIYDLVNLTK